MTNRSKYKTLLSPRIINAINHFTRRIIPVAFALTLILLIAIPVTKAASIREFNLPPGSSEPYGIASDGNNVWIAVSGSDRIDKMRQDTGELWEIPLEVASRPYEILYDPVNSKVWFSEAERDKISSINEADFSLTRYDLESAAGPKGVAIQYNYEGANPGIWFTEYNKGAIGVLIPDLAPPRRTVWYLPDANCKPLSIITTSSGVWFTEYESHQIGNFNPTTNQLKEWPLEAGSFPWDLANDTFGNIWFTKSGNNKIGKLNPYTNEITEYTIPTPNSQPFGITIDKYNRVWIALHATNAIARFTPGSNTFVLFQRAVIGGTPNDILWEEGSIEIWFSDGAGRVGKLDETSAITTMTVSTITSAITESSTATTKGTSTASATSLSQTPVTTSSASVTNTSTIVSTTGYYVSETSKILKTSAGITSTFNITVTGTTTTVKTSYTGTVTTETSLTATQYKTSTITNTQPKTLTYTSCISTTTTTATVPTINTVTATTYQFTTGTGIPIIPGYTNPSIIIGLALGTLIILGMSVMRRGFKLRSMAGLRKILVLIAIMVLALSVVSQPARAAIITEWSLPSGSTMPYGITYNDQTPYRMWFTEYGGDAIGRLDHLSGEILEFKMPIGSAPWGIALEPSRHELWFTMAGRNYVGVVQDYGGNPFKEIPLPGTYGAGPRGIAVQANVNGTDKPYIWVAHYIAHSIVKIDPYESGAITSWHLGDSALPQSIIFVKETGVWFTDVGQKMIGNLNPLTGETRTWNVPSNGVPWDLAVDSHGYIIFSEHGTGWIGVLNPYSGEIIEYRMPSGSSIPYGIDVDASDNVWIADHGLNRITRFSLDDLTFTQFARTGGGLMWDVIVTQEGWIWGTDEGAGRIVRLDPTQQKMSITTSSISTASKTTTTPAIASSTIASSTKTQTTGEVATTQSYAPTTVTTTYGMTETVRILQTSYTQTITDYSTTTLFAFGDSTYYIPTTVATQTSTQYKTITQTSTIQQTITGTCVSTYPIYSTTIATVTTTVTTSFWDGMIPGFSTLAMIIGLMIGALSLMVAHRTRRTRRTH